jgi:hypothetical protein
MPLASLEIPVGVAAGGGSGSAATCTRDVVNTPDTRGAVGGEDEGNALLVHTCQVGEDCTLHKG